MNKILDKRDWLIKESNSIISFETTSGGDWDKWDRYITLEGKKAFHIGNVCGTCEFFFERLGGANGANQGSSPKKISKVLEEGIKRLDYDFLSKVSLIIPDGDYIVSLLDINPKFIELESDQDYFSNEQIKVWGIDGFLGWPHYPKVKYYRGVTKELTNTSKL